MSSRKFFDKTRVVSGHVVSCRLVSPIPACQHIQAQNHISAAFVRKHSRDVMVLQYTIALTLEKNPIIVTLVVNPFRMEAIIEPIVAFTLAKNPSDATYAARRLE